MKNKYLKLGVVLFLYAIMTVVALWAAITVGPQYGWSQTQIQGAVYGGVLSRAIADLLLQRIGVKWSLITFVALLAGFYTVPMIIGLFN